MVRLVDTRFTPEWLAAHPKDQGLVDYLTARAGEPVAAEDRRGEVAQLEARRHHDVTERLGRVTCPTLVASGRFDGIAPPGNGEAIAERIPGAELRLYDGGHAFFVQDQAALPDIISFLAQPLTGLHRSADQPARAVGSGRVPVAGSKWPNHDDSHMGSTSDDGWCPGRAEPSMVGRATKAKLNAHRTSRR